MNYQARFSGRPRYVIARGSERVNRAAFLPTRYRERFCTAAFFLLTIALAGCTHGIHSGTGGWPPASSTAPAGVTSSADVVKVRTADVSIPVGGSADAMVTLSISSGFHINANPATFPYLIPTVVNPGTAGGIFAGKPVFPVAQKKKFQFADEPLAVYEGEVQIKLLLRVESNAAKGVRSLPIEVRVQACDNEKCYAPDTLKTTIAVSVK